MRKIGKFFVTVTLSSIVAYPVVSMAGFQIVEGDTGSVSTPAQPIIRGLNATADLQVEFNKLQSELIKIQRELDEAKRDNINLRQQLMQANAQLDLMQNRLKHVTVTFPFGNADFVPQPDVAEKIEVYANESSSVKVRGYTDNVGSLDGNRRVALNRAKSAKSYLLAKGISDTKIGISAELGKYFASNTTEAGRAANRRVEIEFSK